MIGDAIFLFPTMLILTQFEIRTIEDVVMPIVPLIQVPESFTARGGTVLSAGDNTAAVAAASARSFDAAAQGVVVFDEGVERGGGGAFT